MVQSENYKLKTFCKAYGNLHTVLHDDLHIYSSFLSYHTSHLFVMTTPRTQTKPIITLHDVIHINKSTMSLYLTVLPPPNTPPPPHSLASLPNQLDIQLLFKCL